MAIGAVLLACGAGPALAQVVVLYDQTSQPSGDGIPDQDFEAAYDEFDAEAADDFVVDWPDGWGLERIRTVGDQSLERSARSVDVAIHADVAGRPAAGPVAGCAASDLEPAEEDDGSFELVLPAPCLLAPGRYWLVLQTNQDFDPSGQHFWSSRSVVTGSGALWRNPANGFDTGCRDWQALATCGVGASFPDLLFALDGVLLDPPPVVVDTVETAVVSGFDPALAASAAGDIAIAWRREDRLEVQRFDDRGVAVAPSVQVLRGPTVGPPVVGVDSFGAVTVVWPRPGGGVQARFIDESNIPAGPAFLVAATGSSPSVARSPDGLTAIAWQEPGDGGIAARLYDFDGNPMTNALAVDAAGTGRSPAVAMGHDGVWTVAWLGEDGTVRLRSFGERGGNLGTELAAAAGAAPLAPALASRGGNDLVVAWLGAEGLLARGWTAGVGANGATTTVATSGTGGAAITRVAVGGNVFGETVVGWQRDLEGNARFGVRFLDASTAPIGSGLDLGFGRDGVGATLDAAGQGWVVGEAGAGVALQRVALRPVECGEQLVLCVGGADGDRFAVRAAWRDQSGRTGPALPVSLTDDTMWFYFFNPENVEVVLKTLDGTSVNGSFWVFYAALSNLEFTLSVVDRSSNDAAVYFNREANLASRGDTRAFPGATSGVATSAAVAASAGILKIPAEAVKAGPCVASAQVLCLLDGRVELTATWVDFEGDSGSGQGQLLAGQTTGYFWFFNPDNVEIVVKVLDGRAINGFFWVFYASLSNVQFSLGVRDLTTGNQAGYFNPLGTFASSADVEAF